MQRSTQAVSALAVVCLGACGSVRTSDEILGDLRRQGIPIPDESGEVPLRASDAADEPDPLAGETLELADLLEAADRFNPRIAEARASVGAAAGASWQAGLYPNPSVEVQAEDVPVSGGGLSNGKMTIGFVQPIIVGGRRTAAMAAALAHERAAAWDLQETRRAVFGDVRRQVVDVLYLREAIDLDSSLIEVAEQTLEIAETRFDVRAAPESEVIRSRVETDLLELASRRRTRELAAAGERLSSLVGGDPVPLERITAELISSAPAVDVAALQRRLDERHPAVLAAAERVEVAEQRLEQARAGARPDIAVRVAYGFDGEIDEHLVEAGVSVPLTLFDRNQGAILRSRYEVIAAREKMRALRNGLRADLAEAYQHYMAAREQVVAHLDRIVKPAQRSLAQTRAGYTAGRLAFLDLLDAQRTLTRARLQHLELRRELNAANADLHAILGGSLEQPPKPVPQESNS